MLELKPPAKRAEFAHKLARSYHLVRYRSTTYLPVDYKTGEAEPIPAPEETMWLPLNRSDLQRMAAEQFDMLFASDSELAGFDFMVAQNCELVVRPATSLLIRTDMGLRELKDDGQLHDVTGFFVPNTVLPMLNDDKVARDFVWSTIVEWLDSEEEATSLLRHLATSLAPGWSAVKYLLFLGEGRNGKSVLMSMLQELFGTANVSNITRQDMAAQSPVLLDLNGKLLNLVFDGRAEYLKDSGTEKTLIAGEMAAVRRLYESTPTPVQTNALFVESLNQEPKSSDKSSALQKRLVRFQFPNVYPENKAFFRTMLSEEMLGALLSLLVEHYVTPDDTAVALAPTKKALELQLEHMYTNSLALQFMQYLEHDDVLGVTGILGKPMGDVAQAFQSWRIKENDLGTWAEPDVIQLLTPLVNTERRSQRQGTTVRKVRVITSLKPEAQAFIDSLKGDEDDATTVVED